MVLEDDTVDVDTTALSEICPAFFQTKEDENTTVTAT
jgi:hypothetical protein